MYEFLTRLIHIPCYFNYLHMLLLNLIWFLRHQHLKGIFSSVTGKQMSRTLLCFFIWPLYVSQTIKYDSYWIIIKFEKIKNNGIWNEIIFDLTVLRWNKSFKHTKTKKVYTTFIFLYFISRYFCQRSNSDHWYIFIIILCHFFLEFYQMEFTRTHL